MDLIRKVKIKEYKIIRNTIKIKSFSLKFSILGHINIIHLIFIHTEFSKHGIGGVSKFLPFLDKKKSLLSLELKIVHAKQALLRDGGKFEYKRIWEEEN